MGKLKLSALLLGAVLFLGFGATSLSAEMKCGAGKCGSSMSKDSKKSKSKCGAGKCGDAKATKKAAKCGAGKCGDAKPAKKAAKCGARKCGSK